MSSHRHPLFFPPHMSVFDERVAIFLSVWKSEIMRALPWLRGTVLEWSGAVWREKTLLHWLNCEACGLKRTTTISVFVSELWTAISVHYLTGFAVVFWQQISFVWITFEKVGTLQSKCCSLLVTPLIALKH